MPEISSGVPLALSRAERRGSVDDGLSEESWEERTGEGSERVGFDRGRASVRSGTSYEVGIRNPPIRESNLGDFDAKSKSSGRSVEGDVRKSPMRESGVGGSLSVRSVRGGVRRMAVTESEEKRSVEREVLDSEEMGAREKVGAWIDNAEEEVGYDNRFVAQNQWRGGKSPMDFGLDPRGEQVDRRADRIVDETGFGSDELYSRRRVEVLHDDWVRGGDHRVQRGHRDLRPEDGYVEEFRGQRDEMERWRAERSEFGGVQGYDSGASARRRFPVNGYDLQSRYSDERFSGSSSLPNAEMNRAELLRRYNELEEHLSRTGGLPENPSRRGHQNTSSADFYGGLDYDAHDELLRSRSAESVSLGDHARMRPHRMSNRHVPGPYANGRDMDDVDSFPPSRSVLNEVLFDDDASWQQYPGRTPHVRPHYYPQRPAHEYMPRHSMDSTYDPPGLNSQRENLPHPRSLRTHVQAPPPVGYRRYLNPQTDVASDFPDPYGERASGSRFPYSTPPNLSSHSQRSVDSKSDGAGSAHEHGKRVSVVKKNQLLCHPIAGAAPLVICYSCSELLRLPNKLIATKKTQLRVQCGSCHTTLSFNFDKKRPPASMDVPSKISESDNTLDSSLVGITNCESYEFDKTGYTFPSIDSDPSMHLDSRGLNSTEAHINSEPSLPLDSAVDKNDNSSPLMKNTPPGLPLPEHVDYSEKATDVSDDDKGSTNTDNLSPYVQNEDTPIELDLNSDEIPIPDPPESSAEASSQYPSATADVFVNGQPLPQRVVRKAEKMAGPISPGNYWYDSRAGFWGAMGSYCLGIIPPFIKEFGHPMQANCAGGNTGIYVNGRELHEKDLELLASRRLPLTRSMWYVIDISGKVQDEETGDTVVDLGKLAPSVEKAKCGYGMHPPEM